jgi:hypothetical protein
VLREMVDERRVGEVLQAGSIISGHILGTGKVEDAMTVAVQALVVTGHMAQVGSSAGARDGPFSSPGDSRGVVAEVLQSGILDRVTVCHDIKLGKESSLLKVTVGDGALQVACRDEGGLHIGGKGVPPDMALAEVVEVDTTHANLSSISGPQERRVLGDQFSQVGRPGTEASSQAAKGINAAADKGVDADAIGPGLVVGPLQGTE